MSSSMTLNLSHFQLPGIEQYGDRQLVVSLAYGHSPRFNRRRLEGHIYGSWGNLLNALIEKIRHNTFVVAQHYHDGKTIADLTASVMTDAGRAKGEKDYIPDFTIVIAIPIQETDFPLSLDIDADLTDWEEVYILFATTPTLVELKRPPTRRPKDLYSFRRELAHSLNEAQEQLMAQATKVFESQPKSQKVVLIAGAGVWWTWGIFTRKFVEEGTDYIPLVLYGGDDNEGDEDRKDTSGDYQEAGKGKASAVSPSDRTTREKVFIEGTYRGPPPESITDDQLTVFKPPPPGTVNRKKGKGSSSDTTAKKKKEKVKYPSQHFKTVGKDWMEQLAHDVNQLKEARTDAWSKNIFLGSPISNQALGVIHGFLEDAESLLMAEAEQWVQKENSAHQAAQNTADEQDDGVDNHDEGQADDGQSDDGQADDGQSDGEQADDWQHV
ncbi:hypothetical protein Hypma_012322 [Hypsizygus marmoreus]|uniref:Uncharacterized protein n=1 Tax=Hypsizygus marmoreus TaxID=39966 RepID=A0A369JJX6_HYPMA|nr:hypothetical protein Hypma_012322 [Hypsizygus marmoreus]